MAKLAEYLKHHREHACSEIRTPLTSENLVDSGASRWDASFVNVDKEGGGWAGLSCWNYFLHFFTWLGQVTQQVTK